MTRQALVTGASAGLGREIVRQLVLDRGMDVLATARRADRLESLAGELPPGRVRTLSGDLADPGFRGQLWRAVEDLPGGLDLLINNAGSGHYAEFAEQGLASMERIFALNVTALMDLTRRGAAHMKARGGGQIVEISSILGFMGLPYSTAYVASKHAVNGLVKSLRYELEGTGVKVWAACPGRTESEFALVALDDPQARGPLPRGEPTDRVVRGILRGLDQDRAFVFPTWTAWGTVKVATWLPWVFEWWMRRYSAAFFRAEIDRARGEPGRS